MGIIGTAESAKKKWNQCLSVELQDPGTVATEPALLSQELSIRLQSPLITETAPVNHFNNCINNVTKCLSLRDDFFLGEMYVSDEERLG